MKRLFLLPILVVAILCSTAMATAQNSEAPQRYGWGYPYVIVEPIYALFFQPLYGDVESVTIQGSVCEDFFGCWPLTSYFTTYHFNTRGDVIMCVGRDAEGSEESRKTWVYNDNGHVVSFCETQKIDNYKRKVLYLYDSSARLIGASVTGSSDYFGEFSHNVIVNKYNRDIIDLFGIDFFTDVSSPQILKCCTNRKIRPVPQITDQGFSDMPFMDDFDSLLDIKNNYYYNLIGDDISLESYYKIFAARWQHEWGLYCFNSHKQIAFDYGYIGEGTPPIEFVYSYDINGRLVSVKSYYIYCVCEYDDDGKLISRINYDDYVWDGSGNTGKPTSIRVLNYEYDSHGNLIRISTINLQNPEYNSSVEYLIKYRE